MPQLTPMPDPGPIDVRLSPPELSMLPFRAQVLGLPVSEQSVEPSAPVGAVFRCAIQVAKTGGQWTMPSGGPAEPASMTGYVMITASHPGAIAREQVIEVIGDLDGDFPPNTDDAPNTRPRYVARGEVQPPVGLNRRWTLSVDRYGY